MILFLKQINGSFLNKRIIFVCLILFVHYFLFTSLAFSSQTSVLDSLKQIVELNPNQSQSFYFEYGMLYLGQNDYSNAKKQFLECIRRGSQNSYAFRAYTKIGIVFYRQNQLNEAEREFHKIPSTQSSFKDAQHYLKLIDLLRSGQQALDGNQFQLAVNQFQEVVHLDSANLSAASQLKIARRRQEAQNAIEKSQIALELKQPQKAEEFITHAESLWANHPRILELKKRISEENQLSETTSKEQAEITLPPISGNSRENIQPSDTTSQKEKAQSLTKIDSAASGTTFDSPLTAQTLNESGRIKIKTIILYLILGSILFAIVLFLLFRKRTQKQSKKKIAAASQPESSRPSEKISIASGGQHIGKYEIIQELQKGGMGKVAMARHPHFRRPVVIKSILPELVHDENVRQRLIREANILFELDHPNIVRVTDLIEENEQIYIVMQYVEGQNLKQIVKQSGPIKPQPTINLFIQACDALDYLHHKGIIHRDIKPHNMMLENESQMLKLVDFGIVKPENPDLGQTLTSASRIAGTPNYMSPEQLLNDEIDSRTDIFSLGISFYEILTGVHPFENRGSSVIKAILSLTPKPISELKPDLSAELERICQKMIEKDREKRYQTTYELREQLRKLIA